MVHSSPLASPHSQRLVLAGSIQRWGRFPAMAVAMCPLTPVMKGWAVPCILFCLCPFSSHLFLLCFV